VSEIRAALEEGHAFAPDKAKALFERALAEYQGLLARLAEAEKELGEANERLALVDLRDRITAQEKQTAEADRDRYKDVLEIIECGDHGHAGRLAREALNPRPTSIGAVMRGE